MQVPKFKGLDSVNLINDQGGTNIIEGNLKFQQDVKHLLETPLGSVLGNLSYGSNLYKYLFRPVNEATGSLIQEEIKQRIEDNYQDIIIDTVDVTLNKRAIYVKIGYYNNNSNVLDYIELDLEREGDING